MRARARAHTHTHKRTQACTLHHTVWICGMGLVATAAHTAIPTHSHTQITYTVYGRVC